MKIDFCKNDFSVRYIKTMMVTYCIVVVISAALLFLQNSEKVKNEKIRITGEFKSHSLALDNLVVSVEEHLNLFSKKAESYFIDDYSDRYENNLFSSLSDSDEGIYHLDNIPYSYREENIGNLTGYGHVNEIDVSLKSEIDMALSLNSLFQAAKENIPNSSWIYYTSKRQFINIYPWVESSSFSYLDELKTHEFYRWGLPEENPDGVSFWTPIYIDEAGDGLMVTSAKPIYKKSEFVGTVAIDITLDRLINFVTTFDHDAGDMLIVNQQNQIIAHPVLTGAVSNKLKNIDDVLPGGLSGNSQDLFNKKPMTIHTYNDYSYIWYEMKSAPWRVMYVYSDNKLSYQDWIKINAEFFLLIIALSIMIYISNKVTFNEFINPAEKLVNHISLESKETGKAVDKRVPPPWIPWFDKITEIFSENNHLIQEIKEKNESLLEKNTALERYMPKTIVLINVQPECGSSTLGHMLARSFMSSASETKSTVYLEYPRLEKTFRDCLVRDEKNIYHHPDGFDIWGRYDFGVMPELARSSMLMNNVLENYSNVVISVSADKIDESELDVILKYAKVIVLVMPTKSGYEAEFERVSRQVKLNVRQDKTSIYSLYNSIDGLVSEENGSADFTIPYMEAGFKISKHSFDIPEAAVSVVSELIDRVERTQQISIFIPTTTNIDEVADTSAYVDKTMVLFGEKFGGATCSEANGVWNSSKGGLVSETVNIVASYTTEEGLNRHVDDVIEYVKSIKQELNQDAMAIEINKKLILI